MLDSSPPPLTLAQRMGLVSAPPPLLDEHRWRQVKESSNMRQDSAMPCPICQEGFGLSTQVRTCACACACECACAGACACAIYMSLTCVPLNRSSYPVHMCSIKQVLLSCSHVFHLSCLTSFERFSQKKCCPLCRSGGYQKRVIYEGSQYWRHRAATMLVSMPYILCMMHNYVCMYVST